MTNSREIFRVIGHSMDVDMDLKTHGREGTERISYLHKKPETCKEILEAAYEMMRASGMTITIDYDPEEVDTDSALLARDIRLKAQKEKNAKRSTM